MKIRPINSYIQKYKYIFQNINFVCFYSDYKLIIVTSNYVINRSTKNDRQLLRTFLLTLKFIFCSDVKFVTIRRKIAHKFLESAACDMELNIYIVFINKACMKFI